MFARMVTIIKPVISRVQAMLLTTIACLLLLSGCDDSPEFLPLTADARILAFGDSLTAGVGAGGEDNSYPAVLASLSKRSVINAGVSGELTAQGLERLPDVLDEYQPQLLILLEGGNDILHNKPAASTRQNLGSMIAMAQQQGVQVLLIGVPEKRLFSDSAPFYQALAEQYQIPFEAEILSDLLRTASLKSDAVHLNAAGYQQLAEQIQQSLQANGAL